MNSPHRTSSTHANRHRARWALIGVASAILLVAAFVGTALYTDQPSFCASCHEMRPYYDAWAAGPHKGQWCVDCHVDRGYPARFAHKFVALQEVVAHFSGDTKFPRPTPPAVASTHCSACHQTVVPVVAARFDHALHATKGPCQGCHADSGHTVGQQALEAVGALNPTVVRVAFGSDIATVGAGSAAVAGHVTVSCTRCHDLRKTGCSACHTPGHKQRGACEQCHKAGVKWVFSHPTQADCQSCHTPPATHFKPASGVLPPCTTCHHQPGKAWTFAHPAAGADCTTCHAVPAKHFKPASGDLKPCSQCHVQPGVSWKFAHPSSSADCQSCHTPPSGHSSGQCSTCHHQTGVSFAFAHPSTPAPHGISGKACAKCHPNGYSAYFCTCHGNTTGP